MEVELMIDLGGPKRFFSCSQLCRYDGGTTGYFDWLASFIVARSQIYQDRNHVNPF